MTWFVAADVARVLGHREAEKMTRSLDDDEKGPRLVRTPGGDQHMAVLTEAGLYAAILTRQTGRIGDQDGASPSPDAVLGLAGVTDSEIRALASLLLPYRDRVQAHWAGRSPVPGPSVAVGRADLLDLKTVAERLSCSRGHVYNLISAGHLDSRDIGISSRAKTRVTADSLDAYILRGQAQGIATGRRSGRRRP